MTTKPWNSKVREPRQQRRKHRHLFPAALLTPALVAAARERWGGVAGVCGGSWEAFAGLTHPEKTDRISAAMHSFSQSHITQLGRR